MAEPLSVASSIAGLIQLADLISRATFKYIKEAKGAAKEIQSLLEEADDLFATLHKLELVVSRYEDHSFDSTVVAKRIRSCQVLLEKIKARLDRADPQNTHLSKPSIHQRALAIRKTLIWPFTSIETKALREELTQHKTTLSLTLETDTMYVRPDILRPTFSNIVAL
jgi:hypothetical protein